jgi:phospholipid transport system substrate-binding protein
MQKAMRKPRLLTKVIMFALGSVLGMSVLAATQTNVDAAYQTVKGTTDKVLALAQEAKTYYDKDPERFYGEIRTMLDDVTDFQSFARSVMGRHAGKPAMAKLDAAGKEKLQAQIDRFAAVFREGLVQTYAIGILNFNGQKIEVVQPKANPEDKGDSVDVLQLIYGDAPKPYQVQYKMRPDSNGKWRLRNVTIEGINLGIVYRNQFDAAMVTYNNDIDKVIDNWSVAANEEVKAATGDAVVQPSGPSAKSVQ